MRRLRAPASGEPRLSRLEARAGRCRPEIARARGRGRAGPVRAAGKPATRRPGAGPGEGGARLGLSPRPLPRSDRRRRLPGAVSPHRGAAAQAQTGAGAALGWKARGQGRRDRDRERPRHRGRGHQACACDLGRLCRKSRFTRRGAAHRRWREHGAGRPARDRSLRRQGEAAAGRLPPGLGRGRSGSGGAGARRGWRREAPRRPVRRARHLHLRAGARRRGRCLRGRRGGASRA